MDGYGAAWDSNTSNTAKSTVSCLVSAKRLETPNGVATVIVGHRLKETVSVRYDDDQVLEWPLAELSRSGPSKN